MYQVVVVDDEPFIVEGLKHAIDWEGYHLEIALASTSPIAAYEYVRTHTVHLLITDVSMPELDGLTFLKQCKEAIPLLSVIVLSAYNHFEYVRTALRYGAENYLLKPLDPDELTESVRQVVTHLQSREALSKTYGKAALTFRSSFTESWIKNTISVQEMQTRAEILGISLDADCFHVMTISSKQQETNLSHFFDEMLAFLPGHYRGHFFFETPYQLVCVFCTNAQKEQEPDSIEELLSHLLALGTHMQLPLFLAYSDPVFSWQEVSDAYRKVSLSLCFQYSCLSCHKAAATRSPLMEQLHDLLQAPDQTACQQELSRLLSSEASVPETAAWLIPALIACVCPDSLRLLSNQPQLADCLSSCSSREELLSSQTVLTVAALCHQALQSSRQLRSPCVEAVILALEDCSDQNLSLKTLAAKLNIAPSYLGSLFHQQTGYYFNDYLTETRLRYAAKLLEETDLKTRDIAEKSGFSSQTYFNRMFKQRFLMSPVAWKRRKRAGQ